MLRLLGFIFALCLVNHPSFGDNSKNVLGTWKLVSYETEVQATGKKEPAMGRNPTGYVLFNADGRVFLLSPELAGFTDPRYGDFSSGNVLSEPLAAILARAETSASWVPDYLAGVEACRERCPYFGFCGGAHAANRYFELGRFDATETNHCRNSKIHLLEGVLEHAGAQ